ncbi:nitrate/nitrite transporter [Arcanobacterium ihumii]|uniref:nitrate/nitrite transporter n=1 Tax=Arcanobacterium ihumii TaxID=2138162 RepID=UPI000F51C8E0|nr:nitrate/nitrite transporter [Arcanobacterium ihumii]
MTNSETQEKLDSSGKTLRNWNPENPENWNSKIAWTTLVISTFSMIIAFSVWFLVSALAPKLKEIGFDLSKEQLYWLASMPGLSAGIFRLIYTFLPPIVGTRKLIGISSLLYLLPMFGWFFAVQDTSTPFWWLMILSLMCGIGGGSFSGYMPSTGYFFPKRLAGTALNLQAGIGNLGMSVIQLVGPVLMGFGLFGITWVAPQHAISGGQLWVHNPAIFFVPWTILAAILAFVFLKDVPVKANIKEQLDIFSNPNTWYMTALYVMTFGVFSGLAAQFGLLINNNYGSESTIKLAVAGATYAFLGPLIGSIVRVAWGPLCDKFTGGFWTFVSGVGMAITLAVSGYFLINPQSMADFNGFLWAMLAMFFFAGIGNAGTFKQMPMIMPKRQAGGAIGFTAAVASLGPFLVGVALSMINASTFFFACAIFCVLCSAIAWVRNVRPDAPFRG